jgi:hypothetical protein
MVLLQTIAIITTITFFSGGVVKKTIAACGLMHPKLLDGLNCESKGEDNRRKRSWGMLPNLQHFGDRKAC